MTFCDSRGSISEYMEKKTWKYDIIVIAVLLGVSLAAYIAIRLMQDAKPSGGAAVVTVDGTEYGRYALSKDYTERITFADGAYNILVISGGKADITEASCPDKICVRHRAVDKSGQSIVCLPNKVVVEVESGEKADVDMITQ